VEAAPSFVAQVPSAQGTNDTLSAMPVTCASCCLYFVTALRTVSVSYFLHLKLECGPMPNVMAALPNIGGALCSMPQSLPDAHY